MDERCNGMERHGIAERDHRRGCWRGQRGVSITSHRIWMSDIGHRETSGARSQRGIHERGTAHVHP